MQNFPKNLLAGYSEFMAGEYRDKQDSYHQLAEKGQTPKTMIISCCDSRATPETIFNTSVGELFVVRNVANLVPPFAPTNNSYHGTSSALEFAVQALKVENIVVMGHALCGGINAALNPMENPLSKGDFIGNWLEMIEPSAKQIKNDKNISSENEQLELERKSICNSINNLRSFPFIAGKEARSELALHGAWFDIKSGQLWILDNETNSFKKAQY